MAGNSFVIYNSTLYKVFSSVKFCRNHAISACDESSILVLNNKKVFSQALCLHAYEKSTVKDFAKLKVRLESSTLCKRWIDGHSLLTTPVLCVKWQITREALQRCETYASMDLKTFHGFDIFHMASSSWRYVFGYAQFMHFSGIPYFSICC